MLLFGLVSRAEDEEVLCYHSLQEGDFLTLAEDVLAKINPSVDRMSYVYEKHMFHCLLAGGLIYLCVADDKTSRKVAHSFLDDCRKTFEKMYPEVKRNLRSSDCNDFENVLKEKLGLYSDENYGSKMKAIQNELSKVRDIMVDNVERLVERGEAIENLVERSGELESQGRGFHRSARELASHMWIERLKPVILIVVVVVALMLLIFKPLWLLMLMAIVVVLAIGFYYFKPRFEGYQPV
eukprot:NODE_6463_length_882_cov_51.237154_g5868_i0.p1 GENE.NODE_6463_length_882_cov_51.237154_g5868_i0~~NODE_6463_length_882_cov_51.237154_g5868_i0.p1  ORF type:complete len:261 (+),score=45.19 NODE_6463_length_882_cov_51.237154_g5868_i0:70-783(+)